VGGLPWLNPAEFRRVKPEGPKKIKIKIKIYFILFFGPFLARRRRPRGAPRGRLHKKKKFKNKKIKKFFLGRLHLVGGLAGSPAGPLEKNFYFYFYFLKKKKKRSSLLGSRGPAPTPLQQLPALSQPGSL
jgi:hypothetical protein